MTAVVNKRDAKGRVQWCATFAHDTTARIFTKQMNSNYAGHLKFFIEGEEDV